MEEGDRVDRIEAVDEGVERDEEDVRRGETHKRQ